MLMNEAKITSKNAFTGNQFMIEGSYENDNK